MASLVGVGAPSRPLEGDEQTGTISKRLAGQIGAALFIPLAEETGLIIPIGRWVLVEACRQLRDWQRHDPAHSSLTMSVNLSARQFRDPALVSMIATVLTEIGLEPHTLKIEITESLMMEDTDATLEALEALKALGIQIAVDDFGTGYSSLSYLKQFPADALKIDRSFVRELGRSRKDNALVAAMIAAAEALDLQVTVEGIESAEQVEHLRGLACDRVQGFLFARPMPVAAIGGFLQQPALGTPLLGATGPGE